MLALFYLQFQTVINRLKVRLKRLKKPKYLIGGIVGGLYFYFYFFRFWFRVGQNPRASFQISADHVELVEAVAGCALLIIVLLAWIIPHGRAALVFTEAEVNFLFPAPISRRTLIHFKLLKSQMAILFTTLLLTFMIGRFGGGGAAWIRALGWWIILSTLNLHFLGSSFARTMLLDRGIGNWQRRTVVSLLVAAFAIGVFVWSKQTVPNLNVADLTNISTAKEYFRAVTTSGPAPYLLYPFHLVVRPFFAVNGIQFLLLLWPALIVMLVHYFWVVRANVAFEEASIELSRRVSERVAAVRSGNLQPRPKKAKGAPFRLKPTGSPAVALLWKNLIGAGQMFSVRVWIILACSILPTVFVFSSSGGRTQGPTLIGFGCIMVMFWSFMIGPQLLRQDFRQDLPLADVLKALPLRGWQLVFGELLAPAAILTGIQWLLVIIAAASLTYLPGIGEVTLSWRVAIGFGAAIVLPMLNLISLIIPNAAVLLFPGWFQTGREGPQGIEATGQRLILMLGQVLVFLLALVPAALGFAVVYGTISYFGQTLVAIAVASVTASLVLAIEAGIAIFVLGRIFERFDLSSEA
ncbi:MAG TPA: putative ABC exporter domain-containing protein [Verrucomicrobiae bacterium]|nr:putative ABC exporter domain-containing protein [Verrucomicrobiae bacterium]